MFGFGKKKESSLLPPLSTPKAPAPVKDEIELIPEDLPDLPEELPSLELKARPSVSMPERVMEQPMNVIPATQVVAMRAVKETTTSNKYLKT
ncbi:MAG TPA: hypothetical protein VKE88_02985, partial [Candidatus Nanoarchaeia archaeon]|nr:hypothetical protein [Candidatus Nanoarchaeia archaeon]